MKKLLVISGLAWVVRMEIVRHNQNKLIEYLEQELKVVWDLQRIITGIAEEYNYILPLDAVEDLNRLRDNSVWS